MKNNNDLTELAIKHGADKWGPHSYTIHYHNFFNHLRDQPIRMLEIGVGGYPAPNVGGYSLRMWKEYFPKAQIVAVDIHPKHGIEEDRIKIYQGSQDDAEFLKKINSESGPFDIIVDDGSHIQQHQIASFEILFPLLKKDGIYVCEDLFCSLSRSFGGDSFKRNNRKTAMRYFGKLTEHLNNFSNKNPFYKLNYFDLNIVAVHFFRGIVFIQKGENPNIPTYTRIAKRRNKKFLNKIMYYYKERWGRPRKFNW